MSDNGLYLLSFSLFCYVYDLLQTEYETRDEKDMEEVYAQNLNRLYHDFRQEFADARDAGLGDDDDVEVVVNELGLEVLEDLFDWRWSVAFDVYAMHDPDYAEERSLLCRASTTFGLKLS